MRSEFERILSRYKPWSWPPFYDFILKGFTFGNEPRLRELAVSRLKLGKGEVVLDIACGLGNNFHALHEAIGQQGEVVGFDFSPQILKGASDFARARRWTNVSLIRSDAATLPFRDATFDGVLCTLAMSVIPDYAEAIHEAVRVLKLWRVFLIADVKLFEGRLRLLNPILKPLFDAACSSPDRDFRSVMCALLAGVTSEHYYAGLLVAIHGRKEVYTRTC